MILRLSKNPLKPANSPELRLRAGVSLHLKSFLLFCLLSSHCVFAAGLKLTLSVQPSSPIVGERVSVTATVHGPANGNISFVNYPNCPGLKVNWSPSPQTSRKVNNYNGVVEQSFSMTWSGQAIRTGSFTLGPMKINLSGQVLQSPSLRIVVSQAQKKDLYLMKSSVKLKTCYTGQVISLNVDILLSDQEIRKFEKHMGQAYELAKNHYKDIKTPSGIEKDFHIRLIEFRPDETKGARHNYGVPSNNQIYKKYSYRVHRLTYLLEPKRQGRLVIPSFSTTCYTQKMTQQRVRGFFNRLSTSNNLTQVRPGFSVKTEPIIIKVIDPPLEGRPDSFNGLVCEQLNVRLEVLDIKKGQKVQLHSPIPVSIQMSSDLPPENLKLPSWDAQKALLRDFDVSRSSILREDLKNGALFKEIIFRPSHTKLTEIPALHFSWFDPFKKKYQSLKTQTFALSVESVASVDALKDQPIALLDLPKEEPKQSIGGLDGLEMDTKKMTVSSLQTYPWGWVLLVSSLPWLLLVYTHSFSMIALKRSDKNLRNRHGLNDSLKRLKEAKEAGEVLHIIGRYVQKKWGVVDPRKAPLVDLALRKRLEDLLGQLEASGYASSLELDVNLEEVQEVLESMELLD